MLEVRELCRSDIDAINRWRTDRETIGFLAAPFRYINGEVDEAWFDAYMRSRGSCVRIVTVDAEEPDEPLCLTTLAGIDWVNRTAELHVMVAPGGARGRGVGTYSLGAALAHAFDDLGLNRVELDVLESNARARHLYEKLGFSYEGVRRQAVWKPGGYLDLMHMALLSEDFAREVAL